EGAEKAPAPLWKRDLSYLKLSLSREGSVPFPPVSPASPRSILPPGEIQSNQLGSHYLIRAAYPHDHYHGKVRLSRLSSADLQSLVFLMREKAVVPDRDRIVFLDTETTGVHGGTGMCPFLVGLAYLNGDDFHTVQFFIRDFDEEPSMLLALG